MRSVVIIATYNESANIESLANKILALPHSLDILVVDDNSTDGTGEIADMLAKETGRVFTIHRSDKMGLGTALRAGMVWAVDQNYDLICTMDADHSHAPEYLPDMIAVANEVDVVVGSRYVYGGGVQNWPSGRKILSKIANFYARTIMGIGVKDCTSNYRVYSLRFLSAVPFDRIASPGFSFLVEILYEAKRGEFTIKEYPIIFVDRVVGISKISLNEIVKGGLSLLFRRLRRGNTGSI